MGVLLLQAAGIVPFIVLFGAALFVTASNRSCRAWTLKVPMVTPRRRLKTSRT